MAKHPNKRKKIMRSFKIQEISGVDVPAQEPALALIMKRKGAEDPNVGKSVLAKNVVLTSPEAGSSHLITLNDGMNDIKAGNTSWSDGHSHPWIMMAGGEVVIGTAKSEFGEPHIHRVAFTSKATEITGKPGITKESSMPKEVKKTEESTVEELQAQLAHSQAIGSMNDAEKAHYKGLIALESKEVAEVFLKKSSDERKAEVEAEADLEKKNDDPVVYKTLDGIELRKSAGDAFISMAKSNDELRKRLDKTEKKSEQTALEKRAAEELPYLTGTLEERAAMIKALDGIEDESHRKAAMGALKAQNLAMKSAFVTNGHGGQPDIVGDTDSSLDELTKAYQKEHSGMTYEVAYDKIMQTPEGVELYEKTVN